MLRIFGRALASLQLAVVLLVVLAAVLACATVLEAERGREVAQWYVYRSTWFIGILALLGVNLLAATLIRLPWRKHQAGFVVTHAGLLVLLVGSIQTFTGGIEGQVALQEGKQAERMVVSERSVISITRPTPRGQVQTQLAFEPGPVDWPEGTVLDFGTADGVGLKILRFLAKARVDKQWVPDPSLAAWPAIRMQLCGPTGQALAEEWLTGNLFGGDVILSSTRYELLPIPVESMLEDFLQPPTEDLGQAGVLSVHCDGKVQRLRVDESLGKRVPVGTSGTEVEIVAYLPNARPTPQGSFASVGEVAKNPLVELKVHVPGKQQPTRQVAFARLPLLNLDGVHGHELPAKFWYHHAGPTPVAGARLLQTPAGKLFCRAVVGGAYAAAREVREGERISLGAEFSVTILRHLPHAREESICRPLEIASGPAAGAEAAALVEVTLGDEQHTVWLKRNDEQDGLQMIDTSQGLFTLSFGYHQVPLGFQVQLDGFERRSNPGSVGDSAFASTVRIADAKGVFGPPRDISMNRPLTQGRFTLYQSSFQEIPGHREISILTAAYDPGRSLKYLGSLMVCGGVLLMFTMRSYMFKKVPLLVFRGRSVGAAPADTAAGETAEPRAKAA